VKTALPNIRHIEIYPRYGCDPSIADAPYAFLQLMAAKLGATINTSYVARPNTACMTGPDSNAAPLQTGTLFVSLAKHAADGAPKALLDGIRLGHCRNVAVRDQNLLICSNDPGVNWAVLSNAVQPVER
jgi:hypothetical protein